MQGYFIMLFSLAASLRQIKVEKKPIYGTEQIFDARLVWDNGTAIQETGVEIRAYHEDDCSFFSVYTFEKTYKGIARFQLLCSCPLITDCIVTFRAKDYTDGQITLVKNNLPHLLLICKKDNNSIQLNSYIHINISLTDDYGKPFSFNNVTLDDSYGEEFTQKQTFLDVKNGLAEFDSSWSTAGIKLLRIIAERSRYSYNINQIGVCQISVSEEIKNMTLTLNKNSIKTYEAFTAEVTALKKSSLECDNNENTMVGIVIKDIKTQNYVGNKLEGQFVNGKAVFNDVYLMNYGKYEIIAESDYFYSVKVNLEISGYLNVSFPNGIPYDYETQFSVLVDVYKDSGLTEKDSEAQVLVNLTSTPYVDLQGNTSCNTKNGTYLFQQLKTSTEGKYTFTAFSECCANTTTDPIIINETDKVYSINISTNQPDNEVQANSSIIITVNIFNYQNEKYDKQIHVYLEIKSIFYIDKLRELSSSGQANFSITFQKEGNYTITPSTELNYKTMTYETLTILVYDIKCDHCENCLKNNDRNNLTCKCPNLSKYSNKFNYCFCIENSFYNETTKQCECNDTYINQKGRCLECQVAFTDKDITAFIEDNLKDIKIRFSAPVVESNEQDCLYLLNLPDELANIIKSCNWLGSSTMVIHSNDTIYPGDYIIEINETITPLTILCNERKTLKLSVQSNAKVLNPFFEIDAPTFFSKACSSDSIILVSCKPNDNNFIFSWNTSLNDTIFTSNYIELSLEDSSVIFITITLTVTHKIFNTLVTKTHQIQIINFLFIKLTTNIGNSYTMTISEWVEIKPIVIDNCGVEGQYTDFIFSIVSSSSLINTGVVLNENPRKDMLLLRGQNFIPGYYVLRCEVSINSSVTGYIDVNITVVNNELVIAYNRWNGSQGIYYNLEMEVKTNSEDKDKVIYNCACYEGNTACRNRYDENLIQDSTSNVLNISSSDLRESNLTFVYDVYDKQTKKLASKEINIEVSRKYNQTIKLDSINEKLGINENLYFYPISTYNTDAKYQWVFSPNLASNCLTNLDILTLNIPPGCLKPLTKYLITLNVYIESKLVFTIYSTFETVDLPTCSYYSVDPLQTNQWKFTALNCYSPYSRLSYQYGYEKTDGSIIWLTTDLYINSLSLYLNNEAIKGLIKVSDIYGFIVLESPISRRSRMLYSDIFDKFFLNSDMLLADFYYAIDNYNITSDFFKAVYLINYYFITEQITPHLFQAFLGYLKFCYEKGAFSNDELATNLTSTANFVISNYDKALSPEEFQNLIDYFGSAKFSNITSKLFLNAGLLWSKNVYPNKIDKYSNKQKISYNQLTLKEIQGMEISLSPLQIKIPSNFILDNNYLYNLLFFYIDDMKFGLFIYKIATKVSENSFTPLDKPELVPNFSISISINLQSSNYIYNDYFFKNFPIESISNYSINVNSKNNQLYLKVNQSSYFIIISSSHLKSNMFINLIIFTGIVIFVIIILLIMHRYYIDLPNFDHVNNIFCSIIDLNNVISQVTGYVIPIIGVEYMIGFFVGLFASIKMTFKCNSFDFIPFFCGVIGSLSWNLVLCSFLFLLFKRCEPGQNRDHQKIIFIVFLCILVLLIAGIATFLVMKDTCFNYLWFLLMFFTHLVLTPIVWLLFKVLFNRCNNHNQAS